MREAPFGGNGKKARATERKKRNGSDRAGTFSEREKKKKIRRLLTGAADLIRGKMNRELIS